MSDPSARFTIPAYLRSASEGDPSLAEWVAQLPAMVDQVCGDWDVRVGQPLEPGGSCSWAAPASDPTERPLVLKVTRVHAESRHEAEGLAVLAGRGAVQVLRFAHLSSLTGGPETVAMLLERCTPGVELRERPEDQQHPIIATLLQQVWATALPDDHPFRPLTEMADLWADQAEADLEEHPDRLDPGLARAGLGLFRDLAHDATTSVLLCTDLHAGNVLSNQRGHWSLIDPKPYIGDPHYDVIQHILNCERSVRIDPIGLIERVAGPANLDAARVRRWLFARCVQESTGVVPPWRDYTTILHQLDEPT